MKRFKDTLCFQQQHILTLRILGKNFSGLRFEIFFSYFSQKISFARSCKVSALGIILHEIAEPAWKNKKNIMNLLTAEFGHRVVKFKTCNTRQK